MEQGRAEERFFQRCLDQAKTTSSKGNALWGLSRRALERQERFGYTDLEIAMISASPYSAGVTSVRLSVPTTQSTLRPFIIPDFWDV